jgi:hypothetical protein
MKLSALYAIRNLSCECCLTHENSVAEASSTLQAQFAAEIGEQSESMSSLLFHYEDVST